MAGLGGVDCCCGGGDKAIGEPTVSLYGWSQLTSGGGGRGKLGLNIVGVNASARFLEKLAGVTDPEVKRKRIGAEFIAVFDDEANRIAQATGGVEWLVQGTLYPT